jgi:pilus assembly protein CpaE
MDRKASLIIVDSEVPFRKAVQQQLAESGKVDVAGEADNARAGNELILRTHPDIVLLELPQKPEETLKWATQWRSEFPAMQVFVASASKKPDLILAAMRAGASEYISKPLEIKEFQEAIEKAVRSIETLTLHSERAGQAIAVFSKKGGLGVTTLAVNLALGLQSTSEAKTVIVDMAFDLGDVASHLDLRPKFAMADVFDKNGEVDPGNLESSLIRHSSGLFYLGERETTTEPEPITPEQVHQILAHLKEAFNYVILDLPHSFDTHTYEAFQIADRIILVATSDLSTIRATRYALRVFRSLGYDQNKVQILLNRVSKRDSITPNQFSETLEYPVSFEIPSDYRSVIESINTGEPLLAKKPKSDVAKKLVNLAEQFNISGDGNTPGVKPGLFRRALGGS